MSTPETDPHTELLKSIAASLKGIHTSLEHLTGAVEGVAESIEKAHEPEGDLGVHLVGALKDLTSALHKRAQQERSQQPQLVQNRQNPQQGRRDERHQQRPARQEERPSRQDQQNSHDEEPERDDRGGYREPFEQSEEPSHEEQSASTALHSDRGDESTPSQEKSIQPKSSRPNSRGRRRGNGRGGKPSADK